MLHRPALNRLPSESTSEDIDIALTDTPITGDEVMRGMSFIVSTDYRYRQDRLVYPALKPLFVNACTVIAMVGLPARGKTYISKKLCRYLNWCGICSKVYNVGEYRRQVVGVDKLHDFFKADNEEAQTIRKQCLMQALYDLSGWLDEKGHQVAILDATNTTREKRSMVLDLCCSKGYKTFFIESYCTDEGVVVDNMLDIKLFSPDYVSLSREEALDDFKTRLRHYEDFYEPLSDIEDKSLSFLKIMNGGKHYLINQIDGYLQSQVVYYLMNTHARRRSIYLTMHGETEKTSSGRAAGNSSLTRKGIQFAHSLGVFFREQNIPDLKIWTSTLQSTFETAIGMSLTDHQRWKALDGVDYGDCDCMSVEDIEKMFPEEFENRKGPKHFQWRYPNGESYKDLAARLEPVIMELERQNHVLVICHKTVMRCLLAYFLDHNSDELPKLKVPLHTVYKLTPIAYGCRVEKFSINPETAEYTVVNRVTVNSH